MRYFCSVCKETISERVCNFSKDKFGIALCMNHQKTVTPQAIKLSNSLKRQGVNHQLEYGDGFKHVDIAVPWAKLYLELDGKHHAFSSKQMCADDERDKYSQKEGYTTKRIPNEWVDANVDRLARSIATLAKKRYREIKENEKQFSLTGMVKKLLSKLSEQLDYYDER